jgi:hypothetical protein
MVCAVKSANIPISYKSILDRAALIRPGKTKINNCVFGETNYNSTD